jgi:WD40 repeat protein
MLFIGLEIFLAICILECITLNFDVTTSIISSLYIPTSCIFIHFRYPCTSLKMWQDFILCAYGSGHIRVFDTQTWNLTCEVAAHARWITATDVALETGYFLSVSEDSFVKVWQISKEDGRVSLLYNR